jgi:thiamine biosynthesis lipoprotein
MKEYEFSERIMGTFLSVSIVTEQKETAEKMFSLSLHRLKKYEEQFSRFIPTSELSELNTKKSLVVSPLFMSVLITAKDLHEKTHGYFNPLLQIERHGYKTTYESLTSAPLTRDMSTYNITIDDISIDPQTNTVTLQDDQRLDFGGFLKGFLAEREASEIMNDDRSIQGVIVNIGGDLHTRGRDEHDEQFVFYVKNPIRDAPIPVPIEDMSLTTSGTYKRTWTANNESVHHILARDGTKNPDTDIVSVSIIHSHGAEGEAYAKALFSLEPEELEEATHEKLNYIIIHTNGTIQSSL